MKGMANDILSDARMVAAASVIDTACELTLPQMAPGVTLVKSVSDSLPKLYGSEDLLVQAVSNLLQNAANAIADSGRDGTITVRAFPDGQGGVQVEVSDTGAGIKPSDLEKVFSPFFTTRRTQGGTGLGLFFTHGVVKGHRGTLLVRSRVGEGTTFVLRLPARHDRHPLDAGGRDAVRGVGGARA
jgi:signal transduction histidine kinase